MFLSCMNMLQVISNDTNTNTNTNEIVLSNFMYGVLGYPQSYRYHKPFGINVTSTCI